MATSNFDNAIQVSLPPPPHLLADVYPNWDWPGCKCCSKRMSVASDLHFRLFECGWIDFFEDPWFDRQAAEAGRIYRSPRNLRFAGRTPSCGSAGVRGLGDVVVLRATRIVTRSSINTWLREKSSLVPQTQCRPDMKQEAVSGEDFGHNRSRA